MAHAVGEPLAVHGIAKGRALADRVVELLGLPAMPAGALPGLTVGVLAAVTRGSAVVGALRLVAVAFPPTPNFVVALLVPTGLAIRFVWAPPTAYSRDRVGMGDARADVKLALLVTKQSI